MSQELNRSNGSFGGMNDQPIYCDAPSSVTDDVTMFLTAENITEAKVLEQIQLFAQSRGLDLTPEVQRSLFFEYCRTGQIGNNGVDNQVES